MFFSFFGFSVRYFSWLKMSFQLDLINSLWPTEIKTFIRKRVTNQSLIGLEMKDVHTYQYVKILMLAWAIYRNPGRNKGWSRRFEKGLRCHRHGIIARPNMNCSPVQASQSSGLRADAAEFFDFGFEQNQAIETESLDEEIAPIPPSAIFYHTRGDQVQVFLFHLWLKNRELPENKT